MVSIGARTGYTPSARPGEGPGVRGRSPREEKIAISPSKLPFSHVSNPETARGPGLDIVIEIFTLASDNSHAALDGRRQPSVSVSKLCIHVYPEAELRRIHRVSSVSRHPEVCV